MNFRRTCKDVHRLVAESLDHQLPLAERIQVRLHLVACDGCANFKKQMQLLREAMRGLGRD